MPPTPPSAPPSPRPFSWAPVVFLLVFLIVIATIAYFLMEPLMRIAATGTVEQRQKLAAIATLAFSLLIAILLFGIVFTIRFGKMPFPSSEKRIRTVYPDAWKESARRVPTPSAEELEDKPKDEPNPEIGN